MTAPARISQAEIERCAAAARKAGWTCAQLRVDFRRQTVDITLTDRPAAIDCARPNPLDYLFEEGTDEN